MPPPSPAALLHPFEREVAALIRREHLLPPASTVVVALSGGPDSTALLACLAAFSACPGPRLRLLAAHLDHGLRPESRGEAVALRAFARSLRIPLRSARARGLRDAPGSTEDAARRARYAFLAKVARAEGARAVAVGHHKDDRVETILHRLLQGATLRGLAGIPLRRPLPGAPRCEVVRPLFAQDRTAVLAYLADRGLPFLEDPTNTGTGNARARLRTSVLPALGAAYPQTKASLLRLEGLAREASDLLDRDIAVAAKGIRVRGSVASLPRKAFAGRSEEGIRRLLALLFGALGIRRTEPALAAVRRVQDGLEAEGDRARTVPAGSGIEVEIAADRVRVRAAGEPRRPRGARPG